MATCTAAAVVISLWCSNTVHSKTQKKAACTCSLPGVTCLLTAPTCKTENLTVHLCPHILPTQRPHPTNHKPSMQRCNTTEPWRHPAPHAPPPRGHSTDACCNLERQQHPRGACCACTSLLTPPTSQHRSLPITAHAPSPPPPTAAHREDIKAFEVHFCVHLLPAQPPRCRTIQAAVHITSTTHTNATTKQALPTPFCTRMPRYPPGRLRMPQSASLSPPPPYSVPSTQDHSGLKAAHAWPVQSRGHPELQSACRWHHNPQEPANDYQ